MGYAMRRAVPAAMAAYARVIDIAGEPTSEVLRRNIEADAMRAAIDAVDRIRQEASHAIVDVEQGR